MVQESNNDNFEDSFDNEEFNFLEEEEEENNQTAESSIDKQTTNNHSNNWLTKKIILIAGSLIVSILLIIFVINKKSIPSPKTINNEMTVTKLVTKNNQAKTIDNQKQQPTIEAIDNPKLKQTIEAIDNPKLKQTIKNSEIMVKDNILATTTPNISDLESKQDNISPAATVSRPKTAATTTEDPDLVKIINSPGEEKSREEMADLFNANNIEQSQDLANIVKQQMQNINTQAANITTETTKLNSTLTPITATKTEQEANKTKINQLQQTIDSISQEITDNVNNIKQLENKLTDFTKIITKINQNIASIDAKILGLIEAVDSLTRDLSNVKKTISDEGLDLAPNTNNIKTKPQLTYKPPGYSIHAIIPGRAWLKTTKGQIITVAEGDSIGDYGTVAVIDATNNIVRTSSGVSIR